MPPSLPRPIKKSITKSKTTKIICFSLPKWILVKMLSTLLVDWLPLSKKDSEATEQLKFKSIDGSGQ